MTGVEGQGVFYDSERGYPGASVREEPGKFKHQDRQGILIFSLQGSFLRHFSGYSLQMNAKYAYDFLHYLSDPRLDVSTMYVNNHFRQHEIYVSSANMFAILPFWNVDVSVDFQWNKLNADLVDFCLSDPLHDIRGRGNGLAF